MCYTGTETYTNTELYKQKELVLLDTFIADFHEKFYIPKIQKLAFNLIHVRILGNHYRRK